jgi:DNA-binding CsgD family transcriptional regulator
MNMPDLFTATGQLIDAIGAKRFPVALADMLQLAVRYTYTVVFGFRGTTRPLDLFDDFPAGKRKIFVTDYLEGPYLLDPFFLAAKRRVAPGLHRMRDLAPDRFYQGEYYRSYYAQTGLAEEIGFFVDVAPDLMIVVSLMRAQRVFTARELRTLEGLAPVILAAVRRHWAEQDLPPSVADPAIMETAVQVEETFSSFGRGVLTAREREVVEHTLKGHSAEATGEILGISSGTVRIHRRNIYTKLRISSQGELFSKFIQTLGRN